MSDPGGKSAGAVRARILRVYRDFQTALLHRKYYGHRLERAKHLHLAFDLVLVLGTSGTIGAWAIWRTGAGEPVWNTLAAVAVLLGIVKPYLRFGEEVERLSKLWVGYSDLYFDLEQVVHEIQRARAISPGIEGFRTAIYARFKKLGLDQDARPRAKLWQACSREVRREVRAEEFWLPAEETEEHS